MVQNSFRLEAVVHADGFEQRVAVVVDEEFVEEVFVELEGKIEWRFVVAVARVWVGFVGEQE